MKTNRRKPHTFSFLKILLLFFASFISIVIFFLLSLSEIILNFSNKEVEISFLTAGLTFYFFCYFSNSNLFLWF